jgi:hypothetical protein
MKASFSKIDLLPVFEHELRKAGLTREFPAIAGKPALPSCRLRPVHPRQRIQLESRQAPLWHRADNGMMTALVPARR